MIEYIKQNLEPILVGFVAAIIFMLLKETFENIIVKIALIIKK